MRQKILIWLQAFRLRTLMLSLSSTFMGSIIAYSKGKFNLWVFLLASLTSLFLQILSNLANDYGDGIRGSDGINRLGPERVIQSKKITIKEMKIMIIIFILLSLISGSALIYVGLLQNTDIKKVIFFIIGVLAIISALKYTIGKKPYGYIGVGDFFVFFFFGIVGTCGIFYLHTGYFDFWLLLPASSIGFFSTGVLNINNIRDFESDKLNGKKTMVVRLGLKAGKIYHIALISIAILLSIIYTFILFESFFQLIFIITIPFFIDNIKNVIKNSKPEKFNNELKKLVVYTFIFSLTLGIGLLL